MSYRYISDDPTINLEIALYKMLNDLVDINMKDPAPKGSIIKRDIYQMYKNTCYWPAWVVYGISTFDVKVRREACMIENSKDECIECYWKIMKRNTVLARKSSHLRY